MDSEPDGHIESTVWNVTNINIHGGMNKAWMVREKNWTLIQSKKVYLVSEEGQKLEYRFIFFSVWGKGAGFLCVPIIYSW